MASGGIGARITRGRRVRFASRSHKLCENSPLASSTPQGCVCLNAIEVACTVHDGCRSSSRIPPPTRVVPGAESAQAQGFRSSSCESKSRHVLPRVRRVLRCRTLFHTFSARSVHYYEASGDYQLHSAYIRTHYHTLRSYPRVRTFVTRATCISSVGMKELKCYEIPELRIIRIRARDYSHGKLLGPSFARISSLDL